MLDRSLLYCLALVIVCPGCGPQIDPEDLGEVIYEIPEVPSSQPAATTVPHRGGRADTPPQTPPPRSGPARR